MFMNNERVAALRYALNDLIRGISGVCCGNGRIRLIPIREEKKRKKRDRTKILNSADEVGKPITSHNKAYGAASSYSYSAGKLV